ncbi:N-ATPase, AtpR subunit [Enhydrobacter aerosaccus]|uniref:N-ATPase, AtpR subunit n=1 Tax=Enhydrobacter aerosaccus TaxID=225324 RepID=A0A1T4SAZ2_9HYPH|nr:ATP synthase subunit I [Enhydrobacter aerosaccus]SKA25409.1 N-ATPase, AtpR subunit [Enhydrobacter aerosaccus]
MTAHLPFLLAWFIAGAILGTLHWMSLRWSIGLFAAGRSVLLPFLTQLARFASIGAALTFAAVHQGAYALLASAGGVLAARAVALRRAART